jgi:hypothetical protein
MKTSTYAYLWTDLFPPTPITDPLIVSMSEISIRDTIAAVCMRDKLTAHGCTCTRINSDTWQIVVPPGSIEQEIMPRLPSLRYRIKLPDGYELQLIDNRRFQMLELV